VYVGSGGSNLLYAVHAANGTKFWNFDTSSSFGYGMSSPTLSADGKVVYVGTFPDVYAVNV
jgi:outer membrane protein assembly factor BamB